MRGHQTKGTWLTCKERPAAITATRANTWAIGSPGLNVFYLPTINSWTVTRSPKTCEHRRSIQGILNKSHCAEIYPKVRKVFALKRCNGEFIGSFAAYGWLKDPNDKNALFRLPFASKKEQQLLLWNNHSSFFCLLYESYFLL